MLQSPVQPDKTALNNCAIFAPEIMNLEAKATAIIPRCGSWSGIYLHDSAFA
jgi:hypothetical protein